MQMEINEIPLELLNQRYVTAYLMIYESLEIMRESKTPGKGF